MNENIPYFLTWQHMVLQAQELTEKMPELELSINSLGFLNMEDLSGTLAFLKHKYSKKILGH